MADRQPTSSPPEAAAGFTGTVMETVGTLPPPSTGPAVDTSKYESVTEDSTMSGAHTEVLNDNRKRNSDSLEDAPTLPISPKRARTIENLPLETNLIGTPSKEAAAQTFESRVQDHQDEHNSDAPSTLPPSTHEDNSSENNITENTAQSTGDSGSADKSERGSSPLSSAPSSLNSPLSSPSLISPYKLAAEKESDQIGSVEPSSINNNNISHAPVNGGHAETFVLQSNSQSSQLADIQQNSHDAHTADHKIPQEAAVTASIVLHLETSLSDNAAITRGSSDAQSALLPPGFSDTTRRDESSPSLAPLPSAGAGSGLQQMYELVKSGGGRARKAPERYGNLLPTVLSVTETETDTPVSDAMTQENEGRVSNATASKQTPAIPKRAAPRTHNAKSARSFTVRQAARSPKVTKPKMKSTPRPRKTSASKPKTTSAVKPATTSATKLRKKPTSELLTTPTSKFDQNRQYRTTKARNLANASALEKYLAQPQTITKGKGRDKVESLIVSLPTSLPGADHQKLALSAKLTARKPLQLKPEPQGQPAVWAESRQALCETLPYFKSPQSGCYQNDGHVYGFLFDSIGHCREYMDENVIICRAGGGMEADANGAMFQRKDHSMQEAQVKAVLNDIAHHNPLVVICGNRNVAAPCKMPRQYCVLGWYKPVLVWTEKTAGKGDKIWNTVKYRLERLNNHLPAWHAPKESPVSEEEATIAGPLLKRVCIDCHIESPQVYLRSWMCLNAGCPRFWKINGRDAPCGTQCLEYNPAFLLNRALKWSASENEDEPEPAPLRPPVPDLGNAIGDNLTYINTRGICCPKCGKCNSRRLFKGWQCENPSCDFDLPAVHQPVAPAMLHTPWDIAPTLLRNRYAPGVHLSVEHRFGYKISTYTFNGVQGSFIHAAATGQILQEDRGPNEMFAALQVEDMGLQRRTFAVKKFSTDQADNEASRGGQQIPVAVQTTETGDVAQMDQNQDAAGASGDLRKKSEFADGDLMTAFSMNYGMPYKFVASGGSRPFEDGPWPVAETRRRLNWAAQTFLDKREDDMDLNEELIFAYLEGQKIEYHDDGEEGLGPCIATLSLGGRAKMLMRMKMKHHVGCSKTGILTEERPIPGGIEYQKRQEAWDKLQKFKGDTTQYNQRRKDIPKEIGIFEKRHQKADDLVTITLSHGDIVVMNGYDIQKYLEHKVVPEGYLRFALTCRTVLENHLKPEERPEYEVKKDDQKYNGPNI